MTPPFNKGLTLAELLFALAILAFVLTGLLALFTNCIFLNETNRNLSIATSHAQYVMEEIKSTNFSSIVAAYNKKSWDSATITSKGLVALPNERICMSVTGNDPLRVVVTDTWSGRGQRTSSVELRTLITNY